MDDLSKELQDYLIRLGKDEKSVGEKLAGYTRQLINILYSSDARILEEYYGLFGNEPQSLDQLSARYKTTTTTSKASRPKASNSSTIKTIESALALAKNS